MRKVKESKVEKLGYFDLINMKKQIEEEKKERS